MKKYTFTCSAINVSIKGFNTFGEAFDAATRHAAFCDTCAAQIADCRPPVKAFFPVTADEYALVN